MIDYLANFIKNKNMVAIVQRLVHRIVVPMTWVRFPVATQIKQRFKSVVFLKCKKSRPTLC